MSQDFALLGASTAVTTAHGLPYAPSLQVNLGVGRAVAAGALTVTLRLDLAHRARTYFDTVNTPEIAQLDPVTTLNAAVSIEPAAGDGRWRALLGVRNATDEIYPVTGNSSLGTGSGYAEIVFARPRELRAQLGWRFGALR